jgi:hypothetical protein
VALETQEFRRKGTFAGFRQAYALTQDPEDLARMQALASSSDEKSGVFSALVERYKSTPSSSTLQAAEAFAVTPPDQARLAELKRAAEQERLAELQRQEDARKAQLRRAEEARQAEMRREEGQRAAEGRRQEEARMAAQRAQEARAAEERCLRDANCRRAWEERRAQCVQKMQACRQGCDRATGSGSYGSFIANLSAAALARACYAGCTCDSGFGDLLTRFNLATSDSPGASGKPDKAAAAANPPPASKAKVFECRIYCKSAAGPTITRNFEAVSRKDAAKMAGDRANEFCAQDGKSHASPVALAESQCRER